MNKIDFNKMDKKSRLLDSALGLFLEKSVSSVSIDQICRNADVAKGTFYLYFKDKGDIERVLIERESKIIISNFFAKTIAQKDLAFEDRILYFTNLAIDYFIKHKALLELFKRNFYLPLKTTDLNDPQNKEIKDVVDAFIADSKLKQRFDVITIYKLIYIVIEMISSVAYSSICLNMPGPIEEVKPMILDVAKHIFQAA